MQVRVQMELVKDEKMAKMLKENSLWYKDLNRSSLNYKKFVQKMKEQYSLRPTDKVHKFINDIDLINSVLNVLK